jgi:excisionase family DNA binding protein
MKDYLSISGIHETTGIPVQSVYGHIQRGNLKAFKANGRCWLVKKSDLLEFLASGHRRVAK